MRRLLTLILTSALTISCGSTSTAPTTPAATTPAPAAPSPAPGLPAVVVASVAAASGTTERTSTGVIYHINFTLRETGGHAGAKVTSVIVFFFLNNGAADGRVTVTNLSQTQLTAGGSLDYRLNVSDDSGTVDTTFQIGVDYTEDNGRASGINSASPGTISPAPAVNPAPAAGRAFDGTYDFTFSSPEPGGVLSHTTARYFHVVNGNVSTTDGLLSGTVDTFGKVLNGRSVCPFAGKDPATWTGDLNAGAGPTGKFGKGSYSCVGTASFSWSVNNGR